MHRLRGIKRKFGDITLKKIVISTPPEKKIKLFDERKGYENMKEQKRVESLSEKYNCTLHDHDQSICRLYECSGAKYSLTGLKFENLSLKKERREVDYIS